MRISFIIHADFELPGILENWAKKNQFPYSICRPFAGENLPDTEDFDLLIIMGGPQSPLEIEKDPYLKDEIALVKKAFQQDILVLGFCLGLQIIGEAFGAKTERSPKKEIGVFPIELTEDGLKDPLLEGLPKSFPAAHWHNDMPGLTKDAKVLATSKGCPRQIVRYHSNAYGFQCHLEVMRENIEAMIKHCPNDFTDGEFVQRPEIFLSQDFESINQHMLQIIDRFVALKAIQQGRP